jgi:hypothetical protein
MIASIRGSRQRGAGIGRLWAGVLPPVFRDGSSCACSPIGYRPRRSGISIGRSCVVRARGATTREGVGLKSGSLLVREWKGRIERVMVLDDGFAWNGSVYPSLSRVAKAITRTNWNGHRFFGLKAVRSGERSKVRRRAELVRSSNDETGRA